MAAQGPMMPPVPVRLFAGTLRPVGKGICAKHALARGRKAILLLVLACGVQRVHLQLGPRPVMCSDTAIRGERSNEVTVECSCVSGRCRVA
jgi:hypothetical protein